MAIGPIDERLFLMLFTDGSDEDSVQVISLRPAEKQEESFCHGEI